MFIAAIACVADLPAKADVLCMSHNSGNYSCLLCEQKGVHVSRRRGHVHVFPFSEEAPARTKESFKRNAREAVRLQQQVCMHS